MNRLDRLLLAAVRLFPRAFRDSYGGEMRAFLAERVHAARIANGGRVPFAVWRRTVTDLASSIVAEHLAIVFPRRRVAFTAPLPHRIGDPPMHRLMQDVQYAFRGMRRAPMFAAGVVVTLALGIGANATMFGIVDRLLFRPPEHLTVPDRTYRLYFARHSSGKEVITDETQYQRFLDLTSSTRTIAVTAAYAPRSFAVGLGDDTHEAAVGGATASLWTLFDVRPEIGRFFTADEDRPPDGTRVAVLSNSYWKTRYGGSTDVLGKPLKIGPATYTIIGVAPAGFSAMELATPVAFVPLTASGHDAYADVWKQCRPVYCLTWVNVFARAKPGVAPATVTADLTTGFEESYRRQLAVSPRTTAIDVAKPRVIVAPTLVERGPNRSADTRVATWLLGVAAVVLLVACANVGNLLLGRAFRRRREIAVRIAIGASRSRLLAQLAVESLVLAALGCVGGLAIARWGGAILAGLLMPGVDWTHTASDPRVALFAGGVTLGAAILCGIAPAAFAARTDIAASLKAGQREGQAHRSRTRSALLLSQAALSVVLLIGAGLFIRSLRNVGHIEVGYDADHLLWVEPHLRGTPLDDAGRLSLRRALLERASHLPEARDAAIDLGVPFYADYGTDLYVAGIDSVQRLGDFSEREVTAGFFKTVGTRILHGRGIDATDRADAPLAIVVSEAMAKRLWPTEDALGKCIRVDEPTSPCSTVVGIAENIRQQSLGDDDPGLTYYRAFDQAEAVNPGTSTHTSGVGTAVLGGLFVRTTTPANQAIESVRHALQREMPGSGYVVVTSMSKIMEPLTRSWQVGATMFTAFGALALMLAAIGLYSVIAYSVAQRTHEIGVRVALGAQVRDVIGQVVTEAMRVVGPGVLGGALVAVFAGHWIAPLLFKVSPRDPWVFAVVIVALAVVSVIASWLPARRAARVDPAIALRSD